ncbi:MAG: hypothetical protein IPL79_15960 [Myxococcales bacterium]|nr:hypothetical protein [Myxococcales bacterium]
MSKYAGNVLAALAMVVVLGAMARPASAQLQVDRGDQMAQEAIRAQMEMQRFEENREESRQKVNEWRKWMFWAPVIGVAFWGFSRSP